MSLHALASPRFRAASAIASADPAPVGLDPLGAVVWNVSAHFPFFQLRGLRFRGCYGTMSATCGNSVRRADARHGSSPRLQIVTHLHLPTAPKGAVFLFASYFARVLVQRIDCVCLCPRLMVCFLLLMVSIFRVSGFLAAP